MVSKWLDFDGGTGTSTSGVSFHQGHWKNTFPAVMKPSTSTSTFFQSELVVVQWGATSIPVSGPVYLVKMEERKDLSMVM